MQSNERAKTLKHYSYRYHRVGVGAYNTYNGVYIQHRSPSLHKQSCTGLKSSVLWAYQLRVLSSKANSPMQSISFKYFVQSCATNFMHFQIYSYDNNQALIFTATKTGGMGCRLCQNCATCLIYLAPTPCLASYILMVSKGLHFSAFSFCKHFYTRQHKTSRIYFRAFRGKFPH